MAYNGKPPMTCERPLPPPPPPKKLVETEQKKQADGNKRDESFWLWLLLGVLFFD